MSPTALLTCGALAREVLAIVRSRGWDVEVHAISAREHMTPVRIAPLVERRLRELLPRVERIAVVYGDCGTRGELDEVLQRFGVPRVSGPHCYEMYAGTDFAALAAEEPGTFFLTDFLLRSFDGLVWKGLGLDRHPELAADYFRHYTRVVYLAQFDEVGLRTRAEAVAARLGLSLEIRRTGCGALESRLAALLEEMGAGLHAPRREALNEYDCSDSVLARHPVAGARTRRTRARQRGAQRALSGSH